MENNLSKYIGQEFKDAIESLQVKQGTTKDGTSYCFINLKLINGFETRMFVRSGDQFAFTNAFDLLSANKQINF